MEPLPLMSSAARDSSGEEEDDAIEPSYIEQLTTSSRVVGERRRRRPFLRTIYRLKLPFAILSLLVLVVLLAVLESGLGTAQKAVFGSVALVNTAVQVIWVVYLGYRLYAVWSDDGDERGGPPMVLQCTDAWFGLLLAWGTDFAALWFIDGSRFWRDTGPLLVDPSSNWLTAFDFVCNSLHIMTTVGYPEFRPSSSVTRIFIALNQLSSYFFFLAVLGVAANWQAERTKDARKTRASAGRSLRVVRPSNADA